MKKKFKLVLSLVLLGHLLAALSQATERTRTFLDAVRDYNQGHFSEAIDKFNKIAGNGVVNGKLYYNLGNSYLKNNELGMAILWYERAMRLNPDDPDLKFNYQYAGSLVKDQKEGSDITLARILFFWRHYLKATTIQAVAIILNCLLWILVTAMLLNNRGIIKYSFRAYVIPVFCLSVIFTLTVFYNFYENRYDHHAIIIPEKVHVRSGLSGDSTELFILHSGTKVRVEEEGENHYKIFFSEGKIGWVTKADAALI